MSRYLPQKGSGRGLSIPSVPDATGRLHQKLPLVGKPSKVTLKTLQTLGFSSSNDRPLLTTIRFIGLIDGTGSPTPLWDRMRADLAKALAEGLQTGYKGLFELYPDAAHKSDADLRTYFSANSSVGAAAVGRMVSTFKAIAGLADFEHTPSHDEDAEPEAVQKITPARKRNDQIHPSSPNPVTVNVNIQLQLPPDATGEMYERFFAAMSKHVLSLKQP